MNKNLSDKFLLLCKQNYFDKITPSNKESYLKEGYKKIIDIANEYFKKEKSEEFANFFQEGQYFISLWAAHLLVEYGNPEQDLIVAAIKIIKNYSDNPLAPEVANEEKQWILINAEKYKKYL